MKVYRFLPENTHGVFMEIKNRSVDATSTRKPSGVINTLLTSAEKGYKTALTKIQKTFPVVGAVAGAGGAVAGGIVDLTVSEIESFNTKEAKVATLVLPMPNDVKVTYSANWAGQSVSALNYAIRNIIESKDQAELGRQTKFMTKNVTTGVFNQTIGKIPIAGDTIANIVKGAALSSGIAYNPYKQLMYDSPELRHFSFSWILSPKNIHESVAIHNIIWQLKKSMHPQTMGDASLEESMLLLTPDFIDIKFILPDEDGPNKWLPILKKAVITNLSVNYETKFHGKVAEEHDAGAPAAISFTMDIMETSILTQNDFKVNTGAYTP